MTGLGMKTKNIILIINNSVTPGHSVSVSPPVLGPACDFEVI